MDAEKRKRDDGDQLADGKRVKSEDENDRPMTTTEEEVEEFFNILRRMHVAAKHFAKTDGTAVGRNLGLCFEERDFEEDSGIVNDREQDIENNLKRDLGFDLNSDPA